MSSITENALSSAEALPQTRRKAHEKKKSGKMRGSWHVQQQQRFRLEKQYLYSDALGRFYHGARRSSRAGVSQDSHKSLTALEL